MWLVSPIAMSIKSSNVHKLKTLEIKLKPIDGEKMETNEVSQEEEDKLLSGESEGASGSDIMNILINIQKDTSSTNKKLDSYVSANNKKLENMSNMISKNNGEIAQLTEKVKSCEDLSNAVNFSFELQKQKQLRNNISINGIPFNVNENLNDIMSAIFKFLKIDVMTTDINAMYRVKGSRNLIIVKFNSFDAKDKVMKARMEKEIKLNDIFTADSTSPSPGLEQTIYINNHSTPFFGRLLRHGRFEVKEKRLYACWITSNGFFVKKTENGSPLEVNSIDQLKNLSTPSNTVKVKQNKNGNFNNKNNFRSNNKGKKRTTPDEENSPTNDTEHPKSKPRTRQNSQNI